MFVEDDIDAVHSFSVVKGCSDGTPRITGLVERLIRHISVLKQDRHSSRELTVFECEASSFCGTVDGFKMEISSTSFIDIVSKIASRDLKRKRSVSPENCCGHHKIVGVF